MSTPLPALKRNDFAVGGIALEGKHLRKVKCIVSSRFRVFGSQIQKYQIMKAIE